MPHLLPLCSRGDHRRGPVPAWTGLGFSSMETPGGLGKAPLSVPALDPSTSLSTQRGLQLSDVTGSLAMLHPAVHVSLVTQACLPLCDPRDCSPPGSSVHGILQARILEWVAMPSSRGSSPPRDRTHVSWLSCIGRRVLDHHCHPGGPPPPPHASFIFSHKNSHKITSTSFFLNPATASEQTLRGQRMFEVNAQLYQSAAPPRCSARNSPLGLDLPTRHPLPPSPPLLVWVGFTLLAGSFSSSPSVDPSMKGDTQGQAVGENVYVAKSPLARPSCDQGPLLLTNTVCLPCRKSVPPACVHGSSEAIM